MDNIKKICVCGAGTMGSGIAQVAAQHGFEVVQYDVSDAMLSKSESTITGNLQKLAEKGKIDSAQKEAAITRILFTSNMNDCVADVIIEAIAENREAKRQLFHSLNKINDSSTLFATNTSSISIAELSRDTDYAERFAGLHFFNPAPVMKLVEIVRGGKTLETVIQSLLDLSKNLGKIPVVCNDSPGFIVNRVARHYYLESMQMVETGLTDFETIDNVMEATGFKMGPFRLMDMIGMDVNYSVSHIVWEALGKPGRLQPSSLQKSKVDAGHLGRKSGKGFYDY